MEAEREKTLKVLGALRVRGYIRNFLGFDVETSVPKV